MEGLFFKKSAIFLLGSGLFLAGFFVFGQDNNSVPPSAVNYAPNFWFDVNEKYYPSNPLDFYFENNQEISGEIAVSKYNSLSVEEKIRYLTVFYHIEGEGNQWVYQYWFFYVFNDSSGAIENRHYGDWESVFVFVDKDSKQVTKVIGTAHQRKIFDTEIINPANNHIWAYVGEGSHANCVDKEGDGNCDSFKWRKLEKWDKNGYKVLYDNYNLIEITFDFIENFKGAITLENSSVLGINIFDIVKISQKELYIPWGGSPPTHAWEQSSYNNPEELRPISFKYALEKVNQITAEIVGTFSGLAKKAASLLSLVKPVEQQAAISSSLLSEDSSVVVSQIENSTERDADSLVVTEKSEATEASFEIPVELPINVEDDNSGPTESAVDESAITEEPISEPVEEEEETVAEQPIPQSKPPSGLPFFPGGRPSTETDETETLPSPQITWPSPDDILGQIDDLATSTDGLQINLTGTSSPNLSILIFLNSDSSQPDYSTTADDNGNWYQIVTLEHGENVVRVKGQDDDNNQSEEISLNVMIDMIAPAMITDLSAGSGLQRGVIDLSWTASGDDESIGQASQYIIRYSTSSEITTDSWDLAVDIANEPNPALAGTTENLSISDLTPGQTYYWTIKSQDEAGNISEISNCSSGVAQASSQQLLISEIQVTGTTVKDEFIELYNPSNQPFDLSGWSIQYHDSQAESFQKNDFVDNNSIPAYGYFLIANSSYDGYMTADIIHNSFQLSDTGGTIFLVNNQELLTEATSTSIVDKISYGSGTYLFPEGTENDSVLGAEQSLERKATATSTAELLAVNGAHHWIGNNWDTDDNSQDFVLQNSPNPQNSLSSVEPHTDAFPVLADTAWPMFQHDIQHTGVSAYAGSATGTPTSTPKWTVDLGDSNLSSPVMAADGSIYVGTSGVKLYKVDTTGSAELFYDTQTNSSVRTPALASDNTVYLVDNYFIYALSAEAQLKWKYSIANGSPPIIGLDGTVYVASDYYVYALNPNGELIWQSPVLSNGYWVKSPVLASDGTIYTVGKFGACSGCKIVYALNPQDGSIIWQTGSGPYEAALSLSDDGIIYVGGNLTLGTSGLYAFDSSNGIQQWYAPIGDISGSVAAIGQDMVYVGIKGYTFFAIDRSNGNTEWYFNTEGQISASPVIDNQGTIYIGSASKKFFALNPDGTVKWQYEFLDEISASAAIGSDGTVYVGSYGGDLYAFGQ